MKLHAAKFGVALGIVWAFCCVFLSFSTMLFNWGNAWVDLLASLYIGYAPTVIGALIGMVWGFIDAFIGGLVVAWLYNKMVG